MAKIFSVDFRKGSYIDSVNKIVGVPTSLSKLIRTEKGTALARAVNHDGVTYTTGSKSLSKFTVVAWIKQRTTDTKDRYCIALIGNAQIIRRELSSIIYSNYFNAASLGAISIPITTSLNKWMQFVVTYDGVNVVSSVNNKQIVGSPSATTATLDFTSIVVGRGTTTSRYSDSDILKFEVYDDVIGDKELELDYKALLESQITEKPIRGFELVKPTDLSYQKDRGLLAAYNFKRNGDTLVDISGNGNNGTINGAVIQSKEGLFTTDTTSNVLISAGPIITTNTYSVLGRIKINDLMASDGVLFSNGNTTTNEIIDSIGIKGGKLSWNYDTGGTYKAGATTDLPLNSYVDFAFVSDGGRSGVIKLYINGVEDTITSTGFYRSGAGSRLFARSSGTGFLGDCADFRIYNRVLSEQEIKDYHNSFIKPVILEDFNNYSVGETRPKEWQIISGEFEIKEDTEKKYLKCTSTGTIKINHNTTTDADASIDYYDGVSWTTFSGTLRDLITTHAWLSKDGNYLLFTLTTGQAIAKIKIYDGVRQ